MSDFKSLAASIFTVVVVLGCSICNGIYAQNHLTGTVTDQSSIPIHLASITIHEEPNSAILNFGLTNSNGSYKLSLPNDLDSVWLEVTHLNFTPQKLWVSSSLSSLNLVLDPETYNLPEIYVKQEPVTRRGDTLSFDASKLAKEEDDTVEDILARIPGIRIESSGRITYKGLAISKFYIEGLDLLGGRYALATRNLRKQVVRDIEVLEHHQPIRALDSIIRPPNAAINLRLKTKVALTGRLKVGAGVSPFLHEVLGTAFGFQKNQQFNLLGSSNNTGVAQGNNTKNLYENNISERSLINPTVAIPPLFTKDENVIDNQERITSLTWLRKIGSSGQLRTYLKGGLDRLRYRGNLETTLNGDVESIFQQEKLDAQEYVSALTADFSYEVNQKNFYTNIRVAANSDKNNTATQNTFNDQVLVEDYSLRQQNLSVSFSSIISKNKRAFQVWGRADYKQNSYDFSASPIFINTPTISILGSSDGNQTATDKILDTDVYTKFALRKNKFEVEFRTGLLTGQRIITSRLDSVSDDNFGLLFINDVRRKSVAPYLATKFTKRINHWSLVLYAPLEYHRVDLLERQTRDRLKSYEAVFQPELSLSRQLANGPAVSASLKYDKNYDQRTPVYQNYILTSGRVLDRRSFNLNRRSVLQAKLDLTGQEVTSGLYYKLQFTKKITFSNLLSSVNFDINGQAENLTEKRNKRHLTSFNATINTILFSSIDFSFRSNYNSYKAPRRINGIETEIRNNTLKLSGNFRSAFGTTAINFKPRIEYFWSTVARNSAQQTSINFGIFQKLPNKWGKVNFSFAYYETVFGGVNLHNTLFNAFYKVHFKPWKIDLSLHGNNLTGALNFITFQQGYFYDEKLLFRLRPRQFILRLTREF